MENLDLVAPVNPQYFSGIEDDPLLTESAKQGLLDRGIESSLRIQELRDQAAKRAQSMSLNTLRLEQGQINRDMARDSLRSRRQEAAKAESELERQQSLLEKSGQLGGAIEGIVNSEAWTIDEKLGDLDSIVMNHAEAITLSPALKLRLETAYKKVSKEREEVGALREREQEEFLEQEEDQAAFLKEESEDFKDRLKTFNSDFSIIRSASFTKDAGQVTDSLENPADRAVVLGFLQDFGGVDLATLPPNITDRELIRRASDVYVSQRGDLAKKASRTGSKRSTSDRVSKLNIPKE